MMIESN